METESSVIETRIRAVQQNIAQACQRVGRPPGSVTVVAVSKTQSADAVLEAAAAGICHFGENRVEEAQQKMRQVSQLAETPVHWHMVGHVQSRKARHVTTGFDLLHSLDGVKLAERLNQALVEQSAVLDVLLEINVSGETTKQGWAAYDWPHNPTQRQALWNDIKHILTLPALAVGGLMTMAPIVDTPEAARPVFTALRGLRDALANDFPDGSWTELSMGMTDDYPVAVEEGATLVRIGRAIFGERRSG